MRLFVSIAVFICLIINLGACRKKADLFVTEAERERLREESEDLLALAKDPPKGDNKLLYFEMQGQVNRTEYRGDSVFVKVKRPDYLSGTNLLRINDLVVSEGATSQPDMGDQVDVSKPFPIIVTAANGNKHKYIVSVSFTKESGNEILQFVLQGQDKRRNPTQFHGDSIVVFLDQLPQNNPHNTNGLNLNLDLLKISPNASINLNQGQVQNYCSPVEYIVTSESGKQRKYRVYVRVRFQLPDYDFEKWYSTTFTNGRLSRGSYKNLGHSVNDRMGWASFNDGFYATAKGGSTFPLDINQQGGNSYVTLVTQEYQNTATAGQDLAFGVSPGVIFSGTLEDYDKTGGVSFRNYKRGTMKLQPMDLNLNCAKTERPKSFSFKYHYTAGTGERKSYKQSCTSTYQWWTFSYVLAEDCNKKFDGKDSMEVSVLLLDKSSNIIGVGAFRGAGSTGNANSSPIHLTKQEVQFHYKNEGLNVAEQQLINNKVKINGENSTGTAKQWASQNQDEPIAKVQVIITSSHGLWSGPDGTPVGAVGSKLIFDDLVMEY